MRVVGVLVLGACGGGQRVAAVSPAVFVDEAGVERIEVTSTTGEAPNRVLVRALNLSGAAVPSDRFDGITVDGTPAPVDFDGYGYGSVAIEQPGHATLLGGAAAAEAWTVDSAWPAPPLDPVWEAGTTTPEIAVALTRGMAASEGDTVWWAGYGAPSHSVLVADDHIIGLRAVNLDVDGVLDAMAWTTSTLYLLKGRAGGGMAWGGAFQASGLSIAGADAGDLSGDHLPDVAIAWYDQAGVGTLDIWEGGGLFDYTAAEPVTTAGTPDGGVEIADNTGEGLSQVTVLQAGGDWSRFIRGADLRYMPIGPRAPVDEVILPEHSVILPIGDINGDHGDEIAVATPQAVGQPRDFYFVDVHTDAIQCALGGGTGIQCGTEYLPIQDEIGAYYAVGDGNGDYLADVFFLDDNKTVYTVEWDPLHVDGNFAKNHLIDLPAHAPFDVGDLDLDGELDLVLAGGPTFWTWLGHGYGDTAQFWSPRDPPSRFVREDMFGPFAVAELDQDPETIEIVGFGDNAGTTEARVFQFPPSLDRATLVARTAVRGTPTDLAICGADIYLVAGGEVDRISVDVPNKIANSLPGSATRVDCGAGPYNSKVAVLDSGVVTYLDAALDEVGTPLTATGAVDLAIGDLGTGPETHTCSDPGCSVTLWSAGWFATTDPLGTTLLAANGDQLRVSGTGELSAADVDADGKVDLVSMDPVTGLVAIHRAVDQSVAPGQLFRVAAGSIGPLAVRDGDRDGHADLWWIDTEGSLRFSASAPPAETTSTTSGTTTAR